MYDLPLYVLRNVQSYTPPKARANPTLSAINAELTALLAHEQPQIPGIID